MIDYIGSETPCSIIIQYFDSMALTDKQRLLNAILRQTDDYGWSMSNEKREKDAVYFPELFTLFIKYYRADYLKMAISNTGKNDRYFRPNNFIVYMKKQLHMLNK